MGSHAPSLDTLVELHAVDVRKAGLGDLGKPDGFLQRQTEGWISRYEKAKTDEIEEVGPLTDWLARDIPESPPPAVIHNDYKLNNLVLDPEDLTGVRAVLDWEMATVGDPLFDLAVSLSYWIEPGDPDELVAVMPTVTVTPGFMTRKELIDRYAEREWARPLRDALVRRLRVLQAGRDTAADLRPLQERPDNRRALRHVRRAGKNLDPARRKPLPHRRRLVPGSAGQHFSKSAWQQTARR